jgi:hypothetical protein
MQNKLKNTKLAMAAVVAVITVFTACKKEFENAYISGRTDVNGKAMFRMYNVALGSSNTQIFIENSLVTGNNALVGYAGLFPSGALYSEIEPGTRTIIARNSSATSTQVPITINQDFSGTSKYTLFRYDTSTTATFKLIKDTGFASSNAECAIRFANLVRTPASGIAPPNFDLFSVKQNRNLFTNVAQTDITNFTVLPALVGTTDTLHLRATGTTTNLSSVLGWAASPGRNYTLAYRGNYGVSIPPAPTATPANARQLSLFITY